MNAIRFAFHLLRPKSVFKKALEIKQVLILLLMLILCCLLLTSCYKVIYGYQSKLYDNAEQAIEAQRLFHDALLKSIPRTNSPVGGSISIILPSVEYIDNHLFRVKKADLLKDTSDYGQKSRVLREFIVKLLSNEIKADGDAVEKRGIFDKIIFLQSDDPENASFLDDYDYALIYSKDSNKKDRWFIKRKLDNPVKLILVNEIYTSMPPPIKTIIWLDSIEKTARE